MKKRDPKPPTLGTLLNLADVAPGKGVEVWYQRAIAFHGFTTGADPDFEMPVEDLMRTHALLGTVANRDGTLPKLEWLWQELQGEFYSAEGEARPLILARGLHHTSMSTGDIFVMPDGRASVVAFVGFRAGRITAGKE